MHANCQIICLISTIEYGFMDSYYQNLNFAVVRCGLQQNWRVSAEVPKKLKERTVIR